MKIYINRLVKGGNFMRCFAVLPDARKAESLTEKIINAAMQEDDLSREDIDTAIAEECQTWEAMGEEVTHGIPQDVAYLFNTIDALLSYGDDVEIDLSREAVTLVEFWEHQATNPPIKCRIVATASGNGTQHTFIVEFPEDPAEGLPGGYDDRSAIILKPGYLATVAVSPPHKTFLQAAQQIETWGYEVKRLKLQ